MSTKENVPSLQELFNKDATIINPKEITFVGQKAYEAVIGGAGASYAIMIGKNSHLYVLFAGETETPFTGTAEQIVGTFQFTK